MPASAIRVFLRAVLRWCALAAAGSVGRSGCRWEGGQKLRTCECVNSGFALRCLFGQDQQRVSLAGPRLSMWELVCMYLLLCYNYGIAWWESGKQNVRLGWPRSNAPCRSVVGPVKRLRNDLRPHATHCWLALIIDRPLQGARTYSRCTVHMDSDCAR